MKTSTLFDEAQIIDCGDILMVPTSDKIPINEAHAFQSILNNNPDILTAFPIFSEASKHFLEAELQMSGFAFGYYAKKRFSLFIKHKIGEDYFTVGMIWIDSPDRKLGLNTHWTLDYFIIKELRNYGIMSTCVLNLINYVRLYGITQIRGLVTDNNNASKTVLLMNMFVINREMSSTTVDVFDLNLSK